MSVALIHQAGEPHEGTQACIVCGKVLQEVSENMLVLLNDRGEAPPMHWWPEGPVTVGEGWATAGADELRGVPCGRAIATPDATGHP